jgi:hypothetical protein
MALNSQLLISFSRRPLNGLRSRQKSTVTTIVSV